MEGGSRGKEWVGRKREGEGVGGGRGGWGGGGVGRREGGRREGRERGNVILAEAGFEFRYLV